MSVLTELLENFDFIPNEFKRHMLLIRELEDRQKDLIQKRETIKKRLMSKQVIEDEQQRIILYQQLEQVFAELEALSDEKIELSEKLFSMQENFIRKLDQQIDKTEEDKALIEKCNQDAQMEDAEGQNLPAAKLALKKKQQQRGAGGQFISYGKNGEQITTGFGSLEQPYVGGGSKRQKDSMNMKIGLQYSDMGPVNKKRDRAREKAKILHQGTDSLPCSLMGGGRQGRGSNVPFSQDENIEIPEYQPINREEEEAICKMCNLNKPEEIHWVLCDSCDCWMHMSCVGLTKEKLDQIEEFHCPRCLGQKILPAKRTANFDFGGNILDDS